MSESALPHLPNPYNDRPCQAKGPITERYTADVASITRIGTAATLNLNFSTYWCTDSARVRLLTTDLTIDQWTEQRVMGLVENVLLETGNVYLGEFGLLPQVEFKVKGEEDDAGEVPEVATASATSREDGSLIVTGGAEFEQVLKFPVFSAFLEKFKILETPLSSVVARLPESVRKEVYQVVGAGSDDPVLDRAINALDPDVQIAVATTIFKHEAYLLAKPVGTVLGFSDEQIVKIVAAAIDQGITKITNGELQLEIPFTVWSPQFSVTVSPKGEVSVDRTLEPRGPGGISVRTPQLTAAQPQQLP
jgi:hypothetical protein